MTSNWKLVRLDFGKNLAHFGEAGIGTEETTERVRSDTLFSAWVSLYGRIFGTPKLEDLLEKFNQTPDQPPFRVSSTFIYRRARSGTNSKKGDRDQTHRTIYYLPRPMQRPKGYPEDDLAFSKVYRKLNYLPLEIWQRWYQGIGFISSDIEELTLSVSAKTDGALKEAGVFNYGSAFQKHQVPKVSIDRTTRSTNFYQTGFVKFVRKENENSGLYFLLYFPTLDVELENNLYAALELLGEEGIGGERSSGAGQFTATWQDIEDQSNSSLKQWYDVLQFDRGNHHVLLSLFWEETLRDRALLGATARYAVKERGGWVVGPQVRRRMVRMFAEGSVFPIQPMGSLADVTPDSFRRNHNIYRSGVSLSIPIILEDS
jgi:CRISPR-associated protein Csm4